MTFWETLKQTLFGKSLRVQFEDLLVQEEARKQKEAIQAAATEAVEEVVKDIVVAKKTKNQLLSQAVRKRSNHSLNYLRYGGYIGR